MKKIRSIEEKKRILIVSSIILFFLVSSLAVIYSVIDISKSRKMAMKYLTSITKGVTETVDSWLEDKKNMVRLISEMPEIQEGLMGSSQQMAERLQLIQKHYPNMEGIYIASCDGRILSDAPLFSSREIDNLNQLDFWNKFQKGGGQLYLDSHIARSKKSSKLIFTIIKGVFSPQDEFIGVVGITIDWEKFVKKFIIPEKVGETGFVAITDLDGRNIGHPDRSLTLQKLSHYPWMKKIIIQKNGFQEYTFQQEKKMMAFRQSKESGWIVNTSINENELIQQTIHIRNIILLISIIMLAVTLFVIAYLDMFKLEEAEKNLIESERNFKLIFERGNDGIFVHEIGPNGEPGNFTNANSVFLELFQCHKSQLSQQTPLNVFDLSGQNEYFQVLVNLVSAKHHVMETQLNLQGKRLIVEFRLFLIESVTGYSVMGFVRDITERVMSRQKLREHRDFLDKKVQARTMELMTANRKLMSQIKAKEEMAHALMESEDKYRSLIERANDGIMLIHNSQIIFVNKKIALLLEYGEKELFGMALEKIVPHEYWLEINDNYHQRLKGNKVKSIFETQFLSAQGRRVDVEVNAGMINYEGQTVDFLFVRDIAERKRIEEQKRKHQEQMVQTDKLVALGTLVSGVAHEINNPNNAIMLNTPVLEQAWDGVLPIMDKYRQKNGDFLISGMPYTLFKTYLKDILEDIQKSSERIKTIVADLKNFARSDSGQSSDFVDVREVIRSSVKLISRQIMKHTNKLTVKLEHNMPLVNGNFVRMEQVFVNLLQNACHALSDMDQEIVVSAHYVNELNKIEINIEDQGSGISPEYMKQIFDPFFTTKRGIGGTGLGLSVSLRIIKEHNGSINFQSQEGKGTRVTILLPVIQNQISHGIKKTRISNSNC